MWPPCGIWCSRCSFLKLQGIVVQGDEVNERVSRTDSGELNRRATLGWHCLGGIGGYFDGRHWNWMERAEPRKQRGTGDANLGEASQRCAGAKARQGRLDQSGNPER